MRTAIALSVLAGFLAFSSTPTQGADVPSSPLYLTNLKAGVLVTNWSALGTAPAVSNVTTAPILLTVPAYQNMDLLEIQTLDSRDPNNPAWSTNATSARTNAPGVNNLVGYDWTVPLPNITNGTLVRAVLKPIDTNKLVTAIAMNRLAYGPTPYELRDVLGTNLDGIIGGPGATGATKTIDQWIDEQLRPWDFSASEDVTNQFAELAALGARFTELGMVILSNTTITNIVEDPPGTFTTNTTPNTETNGPGTLSFHNFRAWYAMHGVGARRQLLEVMLYWLENHHVSQWTKARDTFSGVFNGQAADTRERVPTALESREHMAFRNALLNPACTWYDLLRIQHESASMIVYLDTNDSIGNDENVANENYAREILELFCMGVDNGYDQRDITALSAAWTGWDVRKIRTNQAGIVGGVPQIGLYAGITNGNDLTFNSSSNRLHRGVYTIQFRPTVHCNSNIYAFYNTTNDIAGTRGNSYSNNYPNGPLIVGPGAYKMVDARFNGSTMNPPFNYAAVQYGRSNNAVIPINGAYSLFIPATATTTPGNATLNTARTNKAYTVMNHLADLPYTQEFICVKLCRLLVHDNFEYGVTGYDFSDATVTPEEQLVWDCMMAWETNTPKGQIWKVIRTITDSDLFRSSATYGRKIKTPLEFTLSAVRALRISTNGTDLAGTFSSDTDGYTLVSGSSSTATAHPLNRMGRYLIFDREEPDGYPETGSVYVGAGALTERNRWISTILDNNQSDGISGGARTQARPSHLLAQFVPLAKRTNPDIVARFFLSCLFPGEGEANLDYYRRRAIEILDTSHATGVHTAGSFEGQAAGSTEHVYRVHRMVALLMTMPRFHEQ
jgi:uncharacterized protein (DUF1800 family)